MLNDGPDGPQVQYYASPDAKKAKGTILLRGVLRVHDRLESKCRKFAFSLQLLEREYFFNAETGTADEQEEEEKKRRRRRRRRRRRKKKERKMKERKMWNKQKKQ